MTKILIIIMLLWSLICTLWILYKDWSGYSLSLDEYDFIFAGPVAWLLVLFLIVFRPVIQKVMNKEHEYKPKSQKYIQKVVKKIIKIYKKHHHSKFTDFFNLKRHMGSEYGDVCGWKDLMIRSPKYEFINKRFERLMWYQKDDTFQELVKYFDVMIEEEMKNNIDGWYDYQDTTLYWLKEEDKGIDKG